MWIAAAGLRSPARIGEMDLGHGVLLIAAIAAICGLDAGTVAAQPVSRTVIALGPDERLVNLNTPVLAISPDGANVVYVASRGSGPAQLFLRPLDALESSRSRERRARSRRSFRPMASGSPSSPTAKLKEKSSPAAAPVTLYAAMTRLRRHAAEAGVPTIPSCLRFIRPVPFWNFPLAERLCVR